MQLTFAQNYTILPTSQVCSRENVRLQAVCRRGLDATLRSMYTIREAHSAVELACAPKHCLPLVHSDHWLALRDSSLQSLADMPPGSALLKSWHGILYAGTREKLAATHLNGLSAAHKGLEVPYQNIMALMS